MSKKKYSRRKADQRHGGKKNAHAAQMPRPVAAPSQSPPPLPAPGEMPTLAGLVGEEERYWRPFLERLKVLSARVARGDLTDDEILAMVDELRATHRDATRFLEERFPLSFRAVCEALSAIEAKHAGDEGARRNTTMRLWATVIQHLTSPTLRDEFLGYFSWWYHLEAGVQAVELATVAALAAGFPWQPACGRVLAAHLRQVPNVTLIHARLFQDPRNRERIAPVLGGLAVASGIHLYGDLAAALRALGPAPGDDQREGAILRQLAPEAAWTVLREIRSWERLGPVVTNWLKREGRLERRESAGAEGALDRLALEQEDAPEPLESVLGDERVAELLSMLKPVDREIVLRLDRGETPEQIAGGLGMTWQAVRTRQSRLHHQFSKLVEKPAPDCNNRPS